MDYNWTEIFKKKTTKELFEIYCGRTFLSISAIEYAKKELENRQFDFQGFHDYDLEKKYKALIDETSDLKIRINSRRYYTKRYLLIATPIASLILFILSFFILHSIKMAIILSSCSAIIFLVSDLIDNRIRKKQLDRLQFLKSELQSLILEQTRRNIEKKFSQEDFEKEIKIEYDKSRKFYLLVAIIFFVLIIILNLIGK
jgi:hypothetical protein